MRERRGQQEVVPSSFESIAAAHADVENENGTAGFAGEHHRPGLGDVARAARAINCKSAIDAFFQPTRHHGESAKTSARRASLRGSESQPFDYLAGPLAIKGRGIHHHHAVVAVPPDNRNDNAVPERPDAALAAGVDALGVLPA